MHLIFSHRFFISPYFLSDPFSILNILSKCISSIISIIVLSQDPYSCGLNRYVGCHVLNETETRARPAARGAPDVQVRVGLSALATQLHRANLTGLVLGCIEAKFCKKICV